MMLTENRNAFIPLANPDIREEDINLVSKVLRSGMLVQGEYVAKLEHSFANYLNVKHAIAVSNGTATLHLALKVIGVKEGDEVIVPAFSYTATANVVELVGAKPVFVDIDEKTFNIDVKRIEEKITTRTKAIIPVHEFGLACDIEKICAIALRHNLHVIEDAACALGAKQNNNFVGSYGIIGSFSLHPRKSITSGEGGIITTSDDEIAKKLKQLRNHGIQMEDGHMNFVEAGFNYRMTDFQAALAWSQFQRFDEIIRIKNKLSEIYFSSISSAKFQLPFIPSDRNHTWQTFHLLLNNTDQKDTIDRLRKNGIGVNYGAQCIPAQTFYQQKYSLNVKESFPNAYDAYKRGLAIPIYEKLSEDDILRIIKTINQL